MDSQNHIVEKMCGFYADKTHLATMLFPYLNKKLQEGEKVETLFNDGMEENANKLVKNLNINSELEKEFKDIKWNKTKKSEIEKEMNGIINKHTKITILVNGTEDKIEKTNQVLNLWIDNNMEKLEGKKIKLINFYEITDYNSLGEILEKYSKVVNTSGEHNIKEIFC